MRKIPPSLLIALALCLLVTYQQAKINGLQSQLSGVPQAITDIPPKASDRFQEKQSVREIASQHISESRDSKTNPDIFNRARPNSKSADHDQTLIELGMLASVESIYGPLIAQLNLNEEETTYFRSLLAERLFNRRELSQKWAHSPEAGQRKQIEAETLRLQKKNDAKIKKFLNYDEEYQEFCRYEPRIPEYQSLSGIKLALADEQMSYESESKLIDTLYQCRIASEGTLQDGLSNWLAVLEQPSPKNLYRQWDVADQHLLERLPYILSETQQTLFLQHWNAMRAVQKQAIATLNE